MMEDAQIDIGTKVPLPKTASRRLLDWAALAPQHKALEPTEILSPRGLRTFGSRSLWTLGPLNTEGGRPNACCNKGPAVWNRLQMSAQDGTLGP